VRTAELTLPFADVAAAEIARAAIEPDNDGFLTCAIAGAELRLEFTSKSTMGLLRSIDDVLGCLRSIEQARRD
jgi:hypothetical protein